MQFGYIGQKGKPKVIICEFSATSLARQLVVPDISPRRSKTLRVDAFLLYCNSRYAV